MTIHPQFIILACLLSDSTLGATITFVHGIREGHRHGRLRRQQRCASNRLARQLLPRTIVFFYETLNTECSPELSKANHILLKRIDHAPFALQTRRPGSIFLPLLTYAYKLSFISEHVYTQICYIRRYLNINKSPKLSPQIAGVCNLVTMTTIMTNNYTITPPTTARGTTIHFFTYTLPETLKNLAKRNQKANNIKLVVVCIVTTSFSETILQIRPRGIQLFQRKSNQSTLECQGRRKKTKKSLKIVMFGSQESRQDRPHAGFEKTTY